MKYAVRSALAALVTALTVCSAAAQRTVSPLANADVIRFAAIGLPEQSVITLVNEAVAANAARFDLSPSSVSDLVAHGISPAVIAAMRQSSTAASGVVQPSRSPEPPQLGPGLKTTLDLTPAGMQPLTTESLETALTEGEKSGVRLNDSVGDLLKKMSSRGDVTSADDLPRAALLMAGPPAYSFSLWSPYSEATLVASAAKRRFLARPTPSLVDLNQHQIVLRVVPSGNFLKAAAIQSVVIKRGSAILHPTSADVKPVEIQNGMGARRTVSEGNFTFPFSAFDPSGPITVVLIGDAGNFEWLVTREELARMK